jgi:hypothetical protein
MSKELTAFFQIFFSTTNEINENKTNTLLRNSELGVTRMLYSDILSEIVKILNKDSSNDGGIFHNYIFNSFQSLQNGSAITPHMTNAINMVNCISPKSKEIVSRYLDIILEDKFTKDDDINRTELYLRKLHILVIPRWRKSENNEYGDDISEFNMIIQKYNVNYSNYMDLFTIISLINNIQNESKLELIPFFEKLIKKYEKYDKLSKKMSKLTVKEPEKNEVVIKKENKTKEPETNEVVIKKEKKTKEKIPASVKNTLWSKHFDNSIQGNCQCCKTEVISKNNFDCGHIISEKNGGSVHLDNLKPICRSCNSSMGTTNMNDFMTKYGFDKIQVKN